MRKLTVEEREQFLAAPHVGIVSIASEGERPPLTVPVWYAYQPGGNLTFFTGNVDGKNRKTRLIETHRALSFSVQRSEPPYRFVTVEGTVTRVNFAPEMPELVAVVSRYLPAEYAETFVRTEFVEPERKQVLFTIRPDRWITGDFGDDGGNEQPMADSQPQHDFPKTSRPATDAMLAAGYTRLEDLTRVTEKELGKLHGMGPKALRILKAELEARGMSFAAETGKE